MPFVSHRLIGSPSVRLIRSPTGSAACFIRLFFSSAHRLAPCLVSPGSPYHRQAGRGGDAILIGVVAAADGVERRRVLLACLGAMGGAARSSLFPISSAHPIDYGSRVLPSSYHPIDGEGAFFSFPPDSLPSALLGLLAGACSPVPGRGMWGLRHGLRRRAAGCLLAFLVPRSALSLPLVRLLLYAPRVACVVVPTWGVVGRLTCYSGRLPVGVGIFQYMPLNGILWLLMGIFGDVVRCLFSPLPVASFSPLCPAACSFSAAVS